MLLCNTLSSETPGKPTERNTKLTFRIKYSCSQTARIFDSKRQFCIPFSQPAESPARQHAAQQHETHYIHSELSNHRSPQTKQSTRAENMEMKWRQIIA